MSSHIDISGSGSSGNISGSALPASALGSFNIGGSALSATGLALPASKLGSFESQTATQRCQSTVQPGETAYSPIDIISGSAKPVSILGSNERAKYAHQLKVPSWEQLPSNNPEEDTLLGINNPEEDTYIDGRLRSVVSIFKVPKFLKESKQEKAYVPKIVSLGPYHSKRAELCPMDTHKRRALRRMKTRFNISPDSFTLLAFKKIFQDDEQIRKSYEEKISCDSQDLAALLTLDGCFLLEILMTLAGDPLISQDLDCYEPIFERRKIDLTGFDILNDILKLENQIPIIVLRHLVELEPKSVDDADEFLFYLLVKTPGIKFYPFDYEKDMEKWSWPTPGEQVHHYLGLLHSLIVSPPFDDGDERAVQIDTCNCMRKSARRHGIPPAVELSKKAGIKFERHKGGIKQIKFNRNSATFYLPPIIITDHTEVLFRNLIALELCKPSEINYVSCYLSLMNKLIDTEKDVAVLKESGIIVNEVQSDAEVANLLNGLSTRVTPTLKTPFEELERDVIEVYESKSKVWLAELKNDYFASPWKILALAGAIVALVLTLLQTIYSAH